MKNDLPPVAICAPLCGYVQKILKQYQRCAPLCGCAALLAQTFRGGMFWKVGAHSLSLPSFIFLLLKAAQRRTGVEVLVPKRKKLCALGA
jgi:hypothetical protein